MARRVEIVSGMLVGVAGVILLIATVFMFGGSSDYGAIQTLPLLSLVSGMMLGVAVAAHIHSRSGSGLALAVIWISAVFLLLMSFLAMFSIGALLLPVAWLALMSAAAGTVAGNRARMRPEHDVT